MILNQDLLYDILGGSNPTFLKQSKLHQDNNEILYEWTDRQISGMGNRMGLYFFLCALVALNDNIIIKYYPKHPSQSFLDVIDYFPNEIRKPSSFKNITYINHIKQQMSLYDIKYDFDIYYKNTMTANTLQLLNFRRKNRFIHPWRKNKEKTFFVFNNKWIIDTIIKEKHNTFINALQQKYDLDKIYQNRTQCDIALHIRLGDVLQKCGEEHTFYGIQYLIDSIHKLKCNTLVENKKATIFIVTQLNKKATHKKWNSVSENISRQIINNYINELSVDSMIGTYYNFKIVSNDILRDYYLMTRVPFLICLDSSMCLMAMLSNPNKSMYPINDIGILGYLKYLKQWENITKYILPQNHLYNEVGLNMSIGSCQARELGWTNAENISKLIDWINTH